MIKTFDELNEKTCSCTDSLKAKLSGENGKRAIVLCGGTGCLSSNSAEIMAKFKKIIEEKGLSDKVSVNQVGCFGFCSQGPFVKIYPEDTLYRLVQLEDVEEIIEKDIEKTIRNLGKIGSVGMQSTDTLILDIMSCK